MKARFNFETECFIADTIADTCFYVDATKLGIGEATEIVTKMKKQSIVIDYAIGENPEGLETEPIALDLDNMVYLDFIGGKEHEGSKDIIEKIQAVFERYAWIAEEQHV